MKKRNLTKNSNSILYFSIFLFITFFLSTINIFGQLSMNSTGEVTISNDLTIIPSGNTGEGYIIIDHSGYYRMPIIYPGINNNGEIGKSTKQFLKGHFRYLWVNAQAITGSDERMKKNKKELNKSLDKILKLKGFKYDLAIEDSITDIDQIGFMAQELQTTIPEAVVYDSAADIYGINYNAIIPILAEAMKEQQVIIEALQSEIDDIKIKSKDNNLKSAEGESTILSSSDATLSPNKPNPFNTETTIEYFLPSTISNATLYIYDLQGKQIKSINIVQRESGSETIYASELTPGMYKYSLVADGAIIGTETMILTE